MKVYLVGEDDYDGTNIHGIYSTREKAIESIDYHNACIDDIKEIELDPINTGEKYETFFIHSIFPVEKIETGSFKSIPSDIKPYSWGGHKEFSFHGYGKTPEEAKSNADIARKEFHPIWQIADNGVEVHHPHPSHIYDWNGSKGSYAVHEDRNVCIIAIQEYKNSGKISEYLTVVK